MKVVVDTNILFSALLNSEGKIGHLLFNTIDIFQFYCANFLKEEIDKHQQKILFISKFTKNELTERKKLLFKQIIFIDEYKIPEKIIVAAEQMVRSIDPDDVPHVALAEYLNAKLWTGDKKLSDGLDAKSYKICTNTTSLWNLRKKALN